jgi:hypothetical protein
LGIGLAHKTELAEPSAHWPNMPWSFVSERRQWGRLVNGSFWQKIR